MEKKKIYIILAIGLLIILLVAYIWFLVAAYKKVYPSLPEKASPKTAKQLNRQERKLGPIEITPEMLEAITPPPDAKPIEITPEMLESITPPPDAKPIEITPEMLESITPPEYKDK